MTSPRGSSSGVVAAAGHNVHVSGDELEAVERWLEKSGHAFELRVARIFRTAGARPVDLSFPYTDKNTGVQREGDVLAHFRWESIQGVPASIEAVVECKSGSDKPWVLFYDRTMAKAADIKRWAYFMHGPFNGVTESLGDIWEGSPPFDQMQVASHVVTAHADDRANAAGNAVRQVVSAASGRTQHYLERQSSDRRGVVVIPVLATTQSLFRCALADDGTLKVEPIHIGVVGAAGDLNPQARVFVVTEAALPEFATSLAERARDAHEQNQ